MYSGVATTLIDRPLAGRLRERCGTVAEPTQPLRNDSSELKACRNLRDFDPISLRERPPRFGRIDAALFRPRAADDGSVDASHLATRTDTAPRQHGHRRGVTRGQIDFSRLENARPTITTWVTLHHRRKGSANEPARRRRDTRPRPSPRPQASRPRRHEPSDFTRWRRAGRADHSRRRGRSQLPECAAAVLRAERLPGHGGGRRALDASGGLPALSQSRHP